ncbi:MAG: CapA family protein [Oscillospiraceae bacterium]|nr:CapA family protein [Oscillospiraceae bacterium]
MTEHSTRVVFTGDLAFSQCFIHGWKDEGCLDAEVAAFLCGADHVVANVEGPVTATPIKSDRPLNHASNPSAGAYLCRMNILTWSLANNHISDCDTEGLLDTLRCAAEFGCNAIGAGENLEQAAKPVALGDAVKVGVLSLAKQWPHVLAGETTPGAFTLDQKKLISDTIQTLRKAVDWVVVMVHCGDEYCNLALPYIRKQYQNLLAMGADIVVGHHPHVVQQYEYVGEKLIVYSLGNFIFDTEHQRRFAHTDTGMLLGIEFKKDCFSMDCFPTHIDRERQRVEKGAVPAIFQNISGEEYEKLWPLAARQWYANKVKDHRTLSKRRLYHYKFLVFLLSIYQCRQKEHRTMMWGRMVSLLGRWKKSNLSDVVAYLQG